ncbi:hypothetical protein [Roseibium aestuarii]|uniref:Uncharacterized protein n=1 Tax=Roseibium aestuarii TaxID=2600299 RepID=A0ABW4JSQ8_9HYPH|nr:hypothetical protein [Roseibium aestuarii]
MLNRLFALAILTSLLAMPFLILVAQKMDGPATSVMGLRTYERCVTNSPVCEIAQSILRVAA